MFFAWPHQAEALIAHPRFRDDAPRAPQGRRRQHQVGRGALPADHHAVGSYGMTETLPLCTAWPWDAPLARRTGQPRPAGRRRGAAHRRSGDRRAAAAGTRGRDLRPRPELLAGYYGEPAGACFDADGFFHTGDLGRLDADGALHFVGRLKDVIKTAGVNVAAAEVEAVLLEHPAVAAAHAVGVPHPTRGEDVAAFVVLEGRRRARTRSLAHCRARARELQGAAPASGCERSSALPIKGSGKVDKAALRAEAARLTAADGPAADRPRSARR